MSRNTIIVDSSAQTVFDVLADPASYQIWVVGNQAIRGYDGSWARPGSVFHHKVGFGLLAAKDTTVVLESVPARRLVIVAQALPLLRATVTFTLCELDSRCQVTMDEQPRGMPWEMIWNPLIDRVVWLRNAESLRRLRRLAEVRAGAVHN